MSDFTSTTRWTAPDSVVAADLQSIVDSCRSPLEQLSGQTILLTGGSGFVGSYLVEVFAYWNHLHPGQECHLLLPTRDVKGLRVRSPRLFHLMEGSWQGWPHLEAGNATNGVDLVIHMASPADPAQYSRNPSRALHDIIGFTQGVLEYAKRAHAKRFLYISSGAVYGRQPDWLPAITEDYQGGPDPLDPLSCYAEGKRVSELLCTLSGIPAVVARLFTFLGPYQDLNASFAVSEFLRMAIDERVITIKGNGLAQRTFCYISDLTAALLHLIAAGIAGEAYNVGAEAPAMTIRSLAELVTRSISGTSVEIKERGGDGVRSRYLPDVKKLNTVFMPTVPVEDGLSRVITSLCLRGRISRSRLAVWDTRISKKSDCCS